ncbi:hydrolase [Pasteurellaceae bacterium Macca]|nr:hydrolase [Pasteurellaceae bacterium Macca]
MKPLKHPIQIVFFDIDETLYYHKEDRIPRSIFDEVVPRLCAKGIIPAIATGRTFGAFPSALKPLMSPAGFELFVTTNGQYNLYQGKVISQYPLSTSRIERAVTKLQALGIEYAFVCPDEIAVSRDTPEIQNALELIKNDYIVAPDYYRNHLVLQLLAFFPQEQTQAVIEAGVLEDDLKEVRWHEYSVDLLNKQNSKARGILDILAHLNINAENAMAFGDGLNDLEMLSTVGFGVAMGNGNPQLKAVADYVTLPIEQDGILDALEKLAVI